MNSSRLDCGNLQFLRHSGPVKYELDKQISILLMIVAILLMVMLNTVDNEIVYGNSGNQTHYTSKYKTIWGKCQMEYNNLLKLIQAFPPSGKC